MTIDEADDLQDDLINKNIGTDVPTTYVLHEGIHFNEYSKLKHAMSGTTCAK